MWPWRENSSNPDQNPMSVIDQGCEFEGRLTFVGTLILNGKLKGEVQSSGTLIVREGGEIQADVRVGVAIVSGQISGHVTAQERVELKKTARIFGDILTPVLSLEEGVVFDGHCEMKGEGPKVVNEAMPSIPTDPLRGLLRAASSGMADVAPLQHLRTRRRGRRMRPACGPSPCV